MQSVIKNRITIHAPIKVVYNELWECEKWSSYIPGCLEVKILERKNNRLIRYMKSSINNRIVEMVTECNYIPYNKIDFKQHKSPWPLKGNQGEWILTENDNNQTNILLIHKIESRKEILSRFLTKFIVPYFFIYRQSQKVLKSIKNKIENNIRCELG